MQQESGEDDISKSTKQLNAVMIKTIGDLLEPIMSDMKIAEGDKSSANPTEISEAAQAQINQRMELMVNEVFKPLVKELKHIFGSPEAILDFSGSETKIIPLASNSGSKIEFLTKLNITKGQSVTTLGEDCASATGDSSSESSPDKSSKKKKKKGSQNSVKKFGEDVQLPLKIECFHNNCDVIAESWPALERHLEESHGFTSLSQSSKLLESNDSPQFSPFSIAKLPTPKSVRERWAELVEIMRTPNVRSAWIRDVIEGEEEFEKLNPKRPPPKEDDSEDERGEEETKTVEATPSSTGQPQLEQAKERHSFTCAEKDCNALVSSVTQLNSHFIHQHGVMPHTCLVCNDVFDQNMFGTELYSHSWHRHFNFAGTYCCQHCDQQFSRHAELSEHIHLYHMATTISAFDLNPDRTAAAAASRAAPKRPPAQAKATAAADTSAAHPNGPLFWAFDYSQAPAYLEHFASEHADLSEEELMAQYFRSLSPTDYIFQLAEMADAIAAAEKAAAAAASATAATENPVQG